MIYYILSFGVSPEIILRLKESLTRFCWGPAPQRNMIDLMTFLSIRRQLEVKIYNAFDTRTVCLFATLTRLQIFDFSTFGHRLFQFDLVRGTQCLVDDNWVGRNCDIVIACILFPMIKFFSKTGKLAISIWEIICLINFFLFKCMWVSFGFEWLLTVLLLVECEKPLFILVFEPLLFDMHSYKNIGLLLLLWVVPDFVSKSYLNRLNA
jgi:hypothetical protein